jgi:hypothetical protein
MLVQTLKDILTAHVGSYADNEVVIHTAQTGVPTNYRVQVDRACHGADFDKRLFLLYPAEPVVVSRVLAEDLAALATRRLEELKAAHGKLSFSYVLKSHEKAWRDGFIEGVKAGFTG